MATYKYRAKKGIDGIIEGNIDAQSEKEAIEHLSQQGYLPLRIEQITNVTLACPVSSSIPVSFKLKVRAREITIFSRQLASLLKSGVPILKALDIIAEQSESLHFKRVLANIHNAIKDGSTFSGVLSAYPAVFPMLYIALIRAGEDSGTLADALLRVADYRQKQDEMISRFRMSMIYPLLMAVVGVATVIFMLVFVLPRLTKIFSSFGEQLPLATQVLISLSQFLRQWGIWIIALLAFLALGLKRRLKTKEGKMSLSIFQLKIPLINKFILKAELARFCRTLELLLKNGIPILRAIDISVPVLDNEVIKSQLVKSRKDLEQGGGFGKSLKGSKIFPALMNNLIIVGEESGRLDAALAEVANNYEHDTDEATRVMGALIEPVMILALGLVIGFMVVAMLLPVFEINILAR